MTKKYIAISLLVSTPVLAIMGGTWENWGDHQAAVSSDGNCTGSLIAPDVVISSAHCPKPQFIGLYDGSYAEVAEVIDHPDYIEMVDDAGLPPDAIQYHYSLDIRIIKLKEKVKTDNVFELPTARIQHDDLVTLWGTGANEGVHNGEPVEQIVLKSAVGRVDTTIYQPYQGRDEQGELLFDENGDPVLIYPNNRDSYEVVAVNGAGCFGDSGGSYVDGKNQVQGLIVGTDAYNGIESCKPDTGATAIYVYDYLDFIKDSIAKTSNDKAVLSYKTKALPGERVRVANVGNIGIDVYGGAEAVEADECGGILSPNDVCYVTMPADLSEFAITGEGDIIVNAKKYNGQAGSVTESDRINSIYGNTGNGSADSNSSSGGGSMGMLSLLALGLASIRRKKSN